MSSNGADVTPMADTKKARTETSHDADISADAATYEQQHVHDVYSAIAPHFSATRYKPWPRVSAFLMALPTYALVADVGCGNGKYFGAAQLRLPSDFVNNDAPAGTVILPTPAPRYVVGVDYSEELLLCTQRSLVDPNTVQDNGRQKQGHGRRRKRNSALSEGEKRAGSPVSQETLPRTDTVRSDALRCPLRGGLFDAAISIAVVHHYATEDRRVAAIRELLRLVRPAGGRVLIYVWALEHSDPSKHSVDSSTGNGLIGWKMHSKYDGAQQMYARYYHFFVKGELERLCHAASVGDAHHAAMPITIVDSFADKSNWCIMMVRKQ